MKKLKTVRLGIIGVGGMGLNHARYLQAEKIRNAALTAVADLDPARLALFQEPVQRFPSAEALMDSGAVDAVLIATPHYAHTGIGIAALQRGLHVLVEKPISVHKADAERLIAAHRNRKQVFSAMFQQRTSSHFRKVKDLIDRGELGELLRVTWVITDWFRSDYYYQTGDWRATWAGEGGGVLLNQCPHQLDLLQWFCGMPKRVTAFCSLGKRHAIEVEDEVTAYLEYPNGATGVFITTTGEAPGTNRLELAGEKGKLTVEDGKISFIRNEIPVSEFSRTSQASFAVPPVWNIDVPAGPNTGGHATVTQNFVDAIVDGVPLIAPAREGIRSVELGNAMLFSGLTGKPVDLPMDGRIYERKLRELIRTSRFRKRKTKSTGPQDLSGSFRMAP
ncbi:MAG: Gfo/Idh/MocA family oxidoreductase [Kiritimatiellia bacterium]|nr:Gfo/Idh/MocA family oxidoreductase [Kiritimatiellia bacterium]